MKDPFLIQRCSVIAPWHYKHRFKPKGKSTSDLKVSELLRLDYMGSAEFEFGAIPATIRRMSIGIEPFEYRHDMAWVGTQYKYEHVTLHSPKTDHIIPCIIKDGDRKDITDFLQRLSSDGWLPCLKENSEFQAAVNGNPMNNVHVINFWWCIDEGNEFVFSYTGDERAFDAVQAFPACIQNSIVYMNAQKALKGSIKG